MPKSSVSHLVWLSHVHDAHIDSFGDKAATLGEMTQAHFPVPTGFCLTTAALEYFLESQGLTTKIHSLLEKLNSSDGHKLNKTRDRIQRRILEAEFPRDLEQEILKAYHHLAPRDSGGEVALRSSLVLRSSHNPVSTAHANYIQVTGDTRLLRHIQKCWASLFESKALFDWKKHRLNPLKTGMAVVIQEMVKYEVGGVMFTENPFNHDKNSVVIEVVHGKGEQTQEHPKSFRAEIDRRNGRIIKKDPVTSSLITDEALVKIANLGQKLHDHYKWPQEVQWVYGHGKAWILDTRPLIAPPKPESSLSLTDKPIAIIQSTQTVLLAGKSASPGVVSGTVKVLRGEVDATDIKSSDVIVTKSLSAEQIQIFKKALAIITNSGGQTSTAAIISRELGVPCIVGTKKATRLLKTGQVITVDASRGYIYNGKAILTTEKIKLPKGVKSIEDLKTKLKVLTHLTEPELAFDAARKYVDGLGMVTSHTLLTEYIGIHPQKIIADKRQKFFVTKLAEGLEEWCRAFYPRPVIYQLSNLTSTQHRKLRGGKTLEPLEANPLIGLRGAIRHLENQSAFKLELAAIRMVRDTFAWKNLHILIPQVRTGLELKAIKKLLGEEGLRRGVTLKVLVSAQVPSAIFSVDTWVDSGIDGIVIDMPSLATAMLAADVNHDLLAAYHSASDPTVLKAVELICKAAKRRKVTCSVYAPGTWLSESLVEKISSWGATSVTVDRDKVEKARLWLHHKAKSKHKKA